jgi:PPOX class probable F420-dependent enzyme
MSAERAQQFLRANHRAVLATIRADGRPQMSPVLCATGADGRVLISTRETAVKTRNLRRDSHAFLCVFTDRFFGDWIQAEGTAEVISLPDAMELLVAYYRTISGEHPDWSDYRTAMVRDRRVIIRVTLTRTGPTVSG